MKGHQRYPVIAICLSHEKIRNKCILSMQFTSNTPKRYKDILSLHSLLTRKRKAKVPCNYNLPLTRKSRNKSILLLRFACRKGETKISCMDGSRGDVNWRACDVGEAKEGLDNELWRMWINGKIGEWAVM